jgi:lactoylglutathione lyase
MSFVHTCVRDIDASSRFYAAMGFEERGRLNFDSAYNIAFVADPDGYCIELIEGSGFRTPQDGPHPSA